jgi:hypothetical protein
VLVTRHPAITHSSIANLFAVAFAKALAPALSTTQSFQVDVIPQIQKLTFETSEAARWNAASRVT